MTEYQSKSAVSKPGGKPNAKPGTKSGGKPNAKPGTKPGGKPNRRSEGTAYEDQAADYLRSLGYEIRVHSFRCGLGEIDLIAYDTSDRALVFAEVKYRRSADAGGPMAAVGYRKQRTISKVAAFYLHRYGYPLSTNCRFDVIGISPSGLEHLKNAFPYRL